MQDTKMVQLLLDKDANTEVFYFNGLKPVHLAAKSGRADIVGILFKKPTEYVGPFQGVGANDMIPFFRQDYNILSKLANHNLCMIQACLRCADIFFECSFFTKALFLYNEAYARHVDPSHPKAIQTLIKRGQCWLGILNEGNALIDAEAAVNALMKTNRQDDECKFGC